MKRITLLGLIVLLGLGCFVAFRIQTSRHTASASPVAHTQRTTPALARPPQSLTAPVRNALEEKLAGSAINVATSGTLSTDERTALAGIEFAYSKAIHGLGLDAEEMQRLRTLLFERAMVGTYAQEVLNEHGVVDPGERSRIGDYMRAEVESKMRAQFGEAKFAAIKEMLDATTHLVFLSSQFEDALATAGVPDVSADQILEIGRIMLQEYGRDNVYFLVRSSQMNPATGLTAWDGNVLRRADALLTPTQLQVLSQSFSMRNRKLVQSTKS